MEETEESILERYSKCLERMKTDYADALYIHAVDTVDMVDHAAFHSAVNKLKADGRVRFAGLSCHGPRGDEGDSMEKILVKAAEDGRYDLMLLVYNFMNKDEGEKVLDACKKNDVGVTIMKSSPGFVVVETWDPDNPTEDQAAYIERMISRGRTKEEAIERIKENIKEQKELQEKTKPFAEKHGIKTNEKLRMASLQWVLNNPKVDTVCMGLGNFDGIDKFIPLSGTKISAAEETFLQDYQLVYNSMYCRHGCNQCVSECAYKLPVSTIMRYSYYFEMQGREKYAMEKYAALDRRNASHCFNCTAPCTGSCPHGVNIQANLLQAHSMLSLV
jgi:predicted aldo/keto reductase-like oxidoreductase